MSTAPKFLELWTVYRSPRDHPGKYVVRKFSAVATPIASSDMFVADTLDEARALLPPGLVCFARDETDDLISDFILILPGHGYKHPPRVVQVRPSNGQIIFCLLVIARAPGTGTA